MADLRCPHCHEDFPEPQTVSERSLRIHLVISRVIAISSLCMAVVGILLGLILWPSPPTKTVWESTGPGTILYYNPSTHVLIHQTDAGYVKEFNPICQMAPAWTHMRANIRYRWIPGVSQGTTVAPYTTDCYLVLGVNRLGEDVK